MIFESLFRQYQSYLEKVRGLSPGSRSQHERLVRRLLDFLARREVFDLRCLRPSDLDAFVQRRARGKARSTIAAIAAGLRGFLRYLAFRGMVAPTLSAAVDRPRIYALESLPRCLARDEIARLFRAIDLRTSVGRRDAAVYALMLSTGLRARETLTLTLEDVDWKQRLIRVQESKTGRSRVVPFSVEAGAALLRYLRQDRPRSAPSRRFFLTLRPRAGRPLRSYQNFYLRLRCYAERAGIRSRVFLHALRHSFAQNLMEEGAGYATLQNMLGHASTRWLSIYTKVSVEALREVADNYAEGM